MTTSRYPDSGRLGLLGWVRLVGVLLSRVAIGTAVVFALCTVVPIAFGWTSVMVVSGSMMPNIHPGDVVVAKPIDAAEVRFGEPILLDNPSKPGRLLLHRVVQRNLDGTFTTKGDANSSADSTPVPASAIRARPRLLIRDLGLPLLWLQHREYGPFTVAVVGFVGLLAIAMSPEMSYPEQYRPMPVTRRRYGTNRRQRTRFRRGRPGHAPAPAARGIAGTAAAVTALTIGITQSSYSSIKSTAASSWTAGTVTFSANSPATAMFTATGAIPGSFGSACIKLTYSGSLAATVKMYVSAVGGTGLASYLAVQVRSGTGSQSDCSDFAVNTTDYNNTGVTMGTADFTKTLTALRTASYDYSTGISSWSTASSTTRTYQVNWIVVADNAGISKTATFDLTWEARS